MNLTHPKNVVLVELTGEFSFCVSLLRELDFFVLLKCDCSGAILTSAFLRTSKTLCWF